jgi:formylglycine-generating enzyme required for sulfatase activity
MPNKLNIYNMLGNVWEWCSGRYYYEDEKSILNQQTNFGIIRGGSFQASSYSETPTPTIRQKIGLGELRDDVGFRIALSK